MKGSNLEVIKSLFFVDISIITKYYQRESFNISPTEELRKAALSLFWNGFKLFNVIFVSRISEPTFNNPTSLGRGNML